MAVGQLISLIIGYHGKLRWILETGSFWGEKLSRGLSRRTHECKEPARCALRNWKLPNSGRKPCPSGTTCCPREELQLIVLCRSLALRKDSSQVMARGMTPRKNPMQENPPGGEWWTWGCGTMDKLVTFSKLRCRDESPRVFIGSLVNKLRPLRRGFVPWVNLRLPSLRHEENWGREHLQHHFWLAEGATGQVHPVTWSSP